jgi:hypothetical protein
MGQGVKSRAAETQSAQRKTGEILRCAQDDDAQVLKAGKVHACDKGESRCGALHLRGGKFCVLVGDGIEIDC